MAMRRPAPRQAGRQPIVCAKIKYALPPSASSPSLPRAIAEAASPVVWVPACPRELSTATAAACLRSLCQPRSSPRRAALRCCAPEMAPSGEPGGEDLLKRAFETHSQDAVGFLILAKTNLGDEAYKQLIKTVQEIVKQSSCTEGGITVKECEEILSEVFASQTHVLKGFQHLLEGRSPFHEHDSPQDLEGAQSFLVKRAMRQCPEFIEMFETYLPDHLRMTLPNEQSCRSPKTSSADKCLTLKSSYRTELGRSIFNDTLVSATSGREDCFKFRTKNHYEENIFKCEDDMFESDMLLHRYKATADFIGNLLQDHVDSDMRIQEHLTQLNHTVAPEEACEHCGLSRTFLRSIPDSSFAHNFPLSSKRGRYLVNMSSRPASIHDACQPDIEDGEFIPDVGTVQLGYRIGPGNTAESYDVAVPSEDECDHCDKSEVRHES
ncbi:hypothetical protein HU200_019347 [Digitaria exilis]|uniref:Histone deacetylase interacting domain-containing protein n=1 Tax=Digitaria exilis TaxID=1010633 RepID=A0A835KCU0_9POAL|nr:hypothetical protein HU200_019347 [Digitaria exilis]